MSTVRGMFTGALSLIALQAVVSSSQSASRVGTLAGDVASIIDRAVSPTVALIPDSRTGTGTGTGAQPSSTTSGSSSSGGSVGTKSGGRSGGTGTAALSPGQFHLPNGVHVAPQQAIPPPLVAPAPSGSPTSYY